MRPLVAGLIVAAGAIAGASWYVSRPPEPVAEQGREGGGHDVAGSTVTAFASDAEAATLATLPSQPLVLRLISYDATVPTSGLDSVGTHTSLHDMFVAANIEITTDVQPVRQYPFGSDYITEAELSTLALEPQSDGAGWRVTGFLLRRGTQPGDYGTILPQGSRQRFAVFTEEIGNQNQVLRTIAHELGHTLNLFHDDGDGSCCFGTERNGTSLMNQNRCLDPGAWRYSLGPKELDHLRHHPVTSVNPNGVVAFGFCSGTHVRQC